MYKLIVMSLTLLTILFVGIAIYFFLKVQAINQQLAVLHNAPNHVVNLTLMNQIASKFSDSLDLWETALLVFSAIFIIVMNRVFKSKTE